jgi:hypothetical protein
MGRRPKASASSLFMELLAVVQNLNAGAGALARPILPL